MPNRVLMLTYSFPPMASAGVFRTLRFTRYLPEFSWLPTVLSVDPNSASREQDASLLDQIPDGLEVLRTEVDAPAERLKNLFRRKRKAADGDRTNGASVEKPAASPGTPPRRPAAWTPQAWARYAWEFAFETPDDKIWWKRPARATAEQWIRENNPEVIYSTGPPHSTHLIAASISKKANLPFVADFRDPWARAPWRASVRNPWGYRLLGRYERRVVNAASRVILNTQRLADQFSRVYPQHADKFRVITNGFDPCQYEEIAGLEPSNRAAPTDSNSRSVVMCHPGSLYNKRDPRPLLKAIARLQDEGASVVFEHIGQHDVKFGLAAYAEDETNKRHFRLSPRIPHGQVLRKMVEADVLVLIQPGTDLQIPGKLFEMIMFGKPILTLADDGATADVIDKYGLGVVASPTDVDDIAANIRRLLAPSDDSAEGEGWQAALKEFDGRALTARLAKCLNESAGISPASA